MALRTDPQRDPIGEVVPHAPDELAANELASSGMAIMELILLAAFATLMGVLSALAWRRRTPVARPCAGGAQEITIGVCGCYAPDRFRARRGVPLRIHFERDDDARHAGRVFFPDFGVEQPLPAGRTTTVELVPEQRGEFLFTSSDGVYAGVFRV